MDWMVSVAQLLLSLSFLVAVHEMGHLLAAKYFGMRVEQFSIGFPPKIWSFRKGETEYAISAIPLGGYVKISGMIDESLDTETMKQEPQSWEFRSKPAWQRLIVMLGGIIVNVVIGIMIFIGITYAYGDENVIKDVINKNGGFSVGRIGEEIGLRSGDKIIKINGQDFRYLEEVSDPVTLLSTNGSYTVDRNGEIITLPIPVNFVQNFNSKKNAGQFVGVRYAPVVKRVSEETIAERVKLQIGDVVVEVNGTKVVYFDEVYKILNDSSKSTVSIKVKRGEEILSFEKLAFPDKQNRQLGFTAPAPAVEGERSAAIVGEVIPGTIADSINMQPNDQIVEVNGIKVTSLDEVNKIVSDVTTKNKISFKVNRGGEVLSFEDQEFVNKKERMIGFGSGVSDQFEKEALHYTHYTLGESIPLGAQRAFTTLFSQIKAFGLIVTGKIDWSESVSGPIGIVQAFDTNWNWHKWWALTGVLSLVLAFMNLLPIPALDGGHVAFLSYEIISSRKPSDKFMEVAQKVGMVFLLVLMVLVLGNDIVKIVRGIFEN
jgi:RIP metalloprotease RseP